jgi:proline iminopeptidase
MKSVSYKKNTKRNKKTRRAQKNNGDPYAYTKLYPLIKPLKKYRMKVSDLHTIAYRTYGNPNGKPVLFVHGGPGSAPSDNSARFFNPKMYYIVLVDQRGCGKSKPTAETRENTTQDLISDFEKIRKFLNIEKWQVFGGSWGSTLSLAYAYTHPERVTELIIRGIFFGSKEEVDWVTQPGKLELLNPEAWDIYSSPLPNKNAKDYFKLFGECFAGKYGEKIKDNALLSWSVWEVSNSHLVPLDLKKMIRELRKDKTYIEMSTLEYHYFDNHLFLPDGYFLCKNNLDKIKNIPTVIVQGRYDLVCPFTTAWSLHKALPHAEFYPTIAGHSAFDDENIKHLVAATDKFSKQWE